jgi:hypothetical protein
MDLYCTIKKVSHGFRETVQVADRDKRATSNRYIKLGKKWRSVGQKRRVERR